MLSCLSKSCVQSKYRKLLESILSNTKRGLTLEGVLYYRVMENLIVALPQQQSRQNISFYFLVPSQARDKNGLFKEGQNVNAVTKIFISKLCNVYEVVEFKFNLKDSLICSSQASPLSRWWPSSKRICLVSSLMREWSVFPILLNWNVKSLFLLWTAVCGALVEFWGQPIPFSSSLSPPTESSDWLLSFSEGSSWSWLDSSSCSSVSISPEVGGSGLRHSYVYRQHVRV